MMQARRQGGGVGTAFIYDFIEKLKGNIILDITLYIISGVTGVRYAYSARAIIISS